MFYSNPENLGLTSNNQEWRQSCREKS